MTVRARWARFRLHTKLMLLIEGSMILLGATIGVLATVRARATLEAELVKRGLAIATDLAMFSVRPLLDDDLAALRRLVNHSMQQDYVRSAAILDGEGRVAMHSDLEEIGRRRTGRVASASGCEAVLTTGKEPLYDIACPAVAADERLGTVVIGYSPAAAEEGLARVRRDILWAWLIAAVLSGGVAFMLASYISGPITRITAAMERTPEGAAGPQLDVRSGDEIGLLAASFNRMAADLVVHRQHLNELVDARTAELRDANTRLEREIAARARIEAELRNSRQELWDLTSHLQSIREQERTDIAREIHDELGQALTALKMDVHWVRSRVPGAAPAVSDRLAAMSRTIDATVHAVRRISSELRPKLLDDLGLSAALEWQAREFEKHSGVTCNIRSDPDDIVLDAARSTALFRVFQETLTNVARHAGASKVDVVLSRLDAAVEMSVEDDGKGIGAGQVADRRSLGIVGMRERVRSLGGRLEIAGQPGRGTIVRVSIPC